MRRRRGPERKGHGGGINVYRMDPTSGAWTHEQLLEIVNPSFLTLDRAQLFLYSVPCPGHRSQTIANCEASRGYHRSNRVG
jgi:6-phosphogluconolactonase (cycloisomerase 2 family)